jgi:hypothetical protein
LGHHEVKHGHLHTDLGRVVRAGHLGGDVELKVGVEGNALVTELDIHFIAFLFDLLGEKRVQQWVEGLVSVFEDHGYTQGDRVLECTRDDVGLVGWLDNLNLLVSVTVLEPEIRLHLRVNEEAPSLRSLANDGTVSRETVLRQALDLPLSNLNSVTANDLDGHVLS